jgi:DNA end-binding protein Ku
MKSRKEEEYFDDIPDEKIPKDMLELASHIVETKKGHFKPEKSEDQYEYALKDLLKKKQGGEKIEAPREREPAKVINLNGSAAQKRGKRARRRRTAETCAKRQCSPSAQESRPIERAEERGLGILEPHVRTVHANVHLARTLGALQSAFGGANF